MCVLSGQQQLPPVIAELTGLTALILQVSTRTVSLQPGVARTCSKLSADH